jgi:hypothetical protein
MVKVALSIRLEAKPGKEKEVEQFLLAWLPVVRDEPGTIAWFGLRLGPSTFARACSSDTSQLEGGLQSYPTPRIAWSPDPERVRQERSENGPRGIESLVTNAPKSGPT